MNLDRRTEPGLVIISCFAIGLGVALTPIGERLVKHGARVDQPVPESRLLFFQQSNEGVAGPAGGIRMCSTSLTDLARQWRGPGVGGWRLNQ